MTAVTGHQQGSGDTHGDGEPAWQPVSRVGPLTLVVLEQLAHSRDMFAKLEQARPTRPDAAVLDDETVSETRRVYGDSRELIHISVAVAWRRASAGDWMNYAAEVGRRNHAHTDALLTGVSVDGIGERRAHDHG